MSEELSEMAVRLRQWEHYRAAQARAARFDSDGRLVGKPSRNRAIHDAAHIREPIGKDGAQLWISYGPLRETWQRLRAEGGLGEISMVGDPDAMNGYVAFPKRHAPRLPIDYKHLVQYIPVHGGVTWACKDAFAVVWGFDTNHYRSETVPRTDPDFIRYQCHLLYHGLQVAEQLWPQFRRADNEQRAALVNKLLAIDPANTDAIQDRLGVTALMNLLIGRIG